jgi:hypothetical protein
VVGYQRQTVDGTWDLRNGNVVNPLPEYNGAKIEMKAYHQNNCSDGCSSKDHLTLNKPKSQHCCHPEYDPHVEAQGA